MAKMTLHWVDTPDHWRLAVYARMPKEVLGPPIVCIHGFAQNHRTWQSGGWDLAWAQAGHPVYLVDLRGHGSSGRFPTNAAHKDTSLRDATSAEKDPPPKARQDEDFGHWKIDDYLTHDIPAVVSWVRSQHAQAQVILCGHSLGGVLSGLYAAISPEDVAMLALLAAPLSPGRTSRRVRLACRSVQILADLAMRQGVRWSWLPMHLFFWGMDQLSYGALPVLGAGLPWLARFDKAQVVSRLWHPTMTEASAVRSLLRYADPEPMSVVLQMTRWMLQDEVLLGEPPMDQRAQLHALSVPLLCAWGDEDRLAPPATQAPFVQTLSGDLQRTLPLQKTNHMDITAGQPAKKVIEALLALWRDVSQR
ncbi:MAG: alpha/beta hydrolase [Myxococcales bacterium]|nr:alpha/beta hydrolase [Myxococcales bacterium]